MNWVGTKVHEEYSKKRNFIINDVDLSNVFDKEGLTKQLSKRILEYALEAEMESHLD